MKNIYFVRHGQSNANATGVIEGPVSQLSEKGIKQAEQIAVRAKKLNANTLISTTYPRALATAEKIKVVTNLEIETCDLFIERIRPSSQKGLLRGSEDYERSNAEYEAALLSGEQFEDSESIQDLLDRADKALEFLKSHKGDRIIVVTHGFFLRALAGRILFGKELNLQNFHHFLHSTHMSNTGITHVIYNTENDPYIKFNNGWRVVSLNDVSHLG